MKRKICVIITARPSYSRVKAVLTSLGQRGDVDLQIVVAGSALLSRYGDVSKVIADEGFTIAGRVYSLLEGDSPTTMAKSTGLAIVELASVLDQLKPDLVVTIADRFETLGNAVAASYMNLPLAHIQGGEVTGSIDEKVRHAVTKLSDLHCVATPQSAERVMRMGEAGDCVFHTGCPSLDLAVPVLHSKQLDFDPYQRYGGVGTRPDLSEGYVVVMQHPVTTEHSQARLHVTTTLEAIDSLKVPALWFWPNVDAGAGGTSAGMRTFREFSDPRHIHFFKNMTPRDFLHLVRHARCLVGNSSVGIRESGFLGTPTVDIGSRQSGRERGQNVVWSDYEKSAIVEAIQYQLQHGRYESNHLYGDGAAGPRIAEILATAELKCEKKWCETPGVPAAMNAIPLPRVRAA